MKRNKEIFWDPKLTDPTLSRPAKPRSEGLTMVLDKGLGMSAFLDLLETASDHIDWIKLGFGTAGLTPVPLLTRKIELARAFGVRLYPGGTFFEVAKSQNKWLAYGHPPGNRFEWINFDGTISLSPAERSYPGSQGEGISGDHGDRQKKAAPSSRSISSSKPTSGTWRTELPTSSWKVGNRGKTSESTTPKETWMKISFSASGNGSIQAA